MSKILHRTPRVLSILLIAFLSLFAMDVFEEPQWFLALLIHLIPSFLLLAITIIAWKKALLGSILFLLFGVALLLFTHFEAWVIAIPAFIVGLLFLISSKSRTPLY